MAAKDVSRWKGNVSLESARPLPSGTDSSAKMRVLVSRHASHPDLANLNPSAWALRSCSANRRGSLPGLTPIRKALTLAFELLATLSHPSAALRAHTIQNAGDHIYARSDRVEPHELHTHLANDSCFSYR